MSPQFTFSFDRQTYTGSFPTRAEALARGIARARQLSGAIDTVYVGQRHDGDPQASGHAEMVIKCMRARAKAVVGEDADDYLRGVTDQEEAALDDAVRDAVVGWLRRTERMPTFFTVKAVSEHPVPSVPQGRFAEPDEVNEVGTIDEPWG